MIGIGVSSLSFRIQSSNIDAEEISGFRHDTWTSSIIPESVTDLFTYSSPTPDGRFSRAVSLRKPLFMIVPLHRKCNLVKIELVHQYFMRSSIFNTLTMCLLRRNHNSCKSTNTTIGLRVDDNLLVEMYIRTLNSVRVSRGKQAAPTSQTERLPLIHK